MKKTIGWVFIILGVFGPLFVITMSFVDPLDDIAISAGLIIKGVIAFFIAVPWGASLVISARKEEEERILKEIKRLSEDKTPEWIEETDGDIPLSEWLKQKGYLDKYKHMVDLDS